MGKIIIVLSLILIAGGPVQAVNSGFGAGVHYNVVSGDIEGGIDSDYFSYILSLRQKMNANMSFEFSIDYYPGKNDIEQVIRPFAALIWGDLINFGFGVTRAYWKAEGGSGQWSDISYLLQGGVQFPVGNSLNLNLDAFYFLQKFSEVKDIDAKNLTFAARLFYRF